MTNSRAGSVITKDSLAADFSTTSTTKTAITGLSIVLGNRGNAIIHLRVDTTSTGGAINIYLDIYDGSAIQEASGATQALDTHNTPRHVTHLMKAAGETMIARMAVNAQTGLLDYDATANVEMDSSFQVIEAL